MRVLIAGGTGFIGQHLTAGALARGWDVTLLVRDPDSEAAQRAASAGAELVRGDVTRSETLVRAIETTAPEIYMHNAGWYELGIRREARAAMRQVNVTGLENALEAVRSHGVPRVVVTSSTTALGETGGKLVDETFHRVAPPFSWYEETLVEATAVIERYRRMGLRIIAGKPAQVIGPGDHSPYGRLFRMYLRRLLPPVVWGPEGAFSFIHVEDTAEAMLRLAEAGRPGEDYFLAGSVMTNRQMLETWAGALGRRGSFLWLPFPAALAMGAMAAPVLRLAGQPAFISSEVVRSSFASFRYNAGKIQSELGVRLRGARQAWLDTISAERSRRVSQQAD